MRKYKEVEVKQSRLESITCDWCGKVFNHEYEFNHDSGFVVDDFKLSWEVGDAYPESKTTDTKTVELCFKCREKLFDEILPKLGINIIEEDTSW